MNNAQPPFATKEELTARREQPFAHQQLQRDYADLESELHLTQARIQALFNQLHATQEALVATRELLAARDYQAEQLAADLRHANLETEVALRQLERALPDKDADAIWFTLNDLADWRQDLAVIAGQTDAPKSVRRYRRQRLLGEVPLMLNALAQVIQQGGYPPGAPATAGAGEDPTLATLPPLTLGDLRTIAGIWDDAGGDNATPGGSDQPTAEDWQGLVQCAGCGLWVDADLLAYHHAAECPEPPERAPLAPFGPAVAVAADGPEAALLNAVAAFVAKVPPGLCGTYMHYHFYNYESAYYRLEVDDVEVALLNALAGYVAAARGPAR